MSGSQIAENWRRTDPKAGISVNATELLKLFYSANGHYQAILKRIRANNDNIARGKMGEFGRHIEVKELKTG